MGWSATSEQESKAIMHLASGDDHTAAIMAVVIVEARLQQQIESQFQRDTKIEKEMFHTSGPLGNFSAKIKLAYLIRVLNEETYRDLIRMKDIRNRFAHWVQVTSFEDSNIKSLADNFTLIEKHFEELEGPGEFKNLHKKDLMMNIDGLAEKLKSPRWRYLMTAMLLSTSLMFPKGNKPFVR